MPHIYAPVNWVSIGSGNGLSPVRCQAIAWTHTDPCNSLNQCWFIVNWTLRNKFQWKLNRNFHSRKCAWKCLCDMTAILSRSQYVNIRYSVLRGTWTVGRTNGWNHIAHCLEFDRQSILVTLQDGHLRLWRGWRMRNWNQLFPHKMRGILEMYSVPN